MSDPAPAVRRRPRRAHLVGAALVVLLVPTLIWIGRVSAGAESARHAALVRMFANVPTGRADAVDVSNDISCTVSPNYTDMPNGSVTFKVGGAKPQSVIVLLQGQWFLPNDGVSLRVRLLIDGSATSGSTNILIAERPVGVSLVDETHGYNFVTDSLAPGPHTAKIQWHDNGVNFGCVANRALIVMHR